MKVLHVLANSPPDVNGYAVRTQMILENQNQLEQIDCLGLSSPWYPDRDSMVDEFNMNGVQYLRTLHPSRKKNSKLSHKLVRLFTRNPEAKSLTDNGENEKNKFILLQIYDFFSVLIYLKEHRFDYFDFLD